MEEKSEVKTGLTAKALILGFLGLIYTALVNYGYPASTSGIYGPAPSMGYYSNSFQSVEVLANVTLFLVIIAIINHGSAAGWWKLRFSSQEVGLIFILVPLGYYLCSTSYQTFFINWFTEGEWVATQSAAKQAASWPRFPDTLAFGPKSAEPWKPLAKIGYGRTLSFDFVPFLPMIITGFLYFSTAILFYVFGSLLLRRLYTRVEYLPMPLTDMMTGFIDKTQPASEKVKFFTQKAFLIGFILSLLWESLVSGWYPWQFLATGKEPAVAWYGGLFTERSPPSWDFSPYGWIPWAPLYITLKPWEIAWGLILPVNVLTSSLIAWFAMFIVFPFAYLQSIYGPVVGKLWRGDDVMWNKWVQDLVSGFSHPCIIAGMVLAAVIAPIVINWHQMAPIFKSLLGKEPPREFDFDRPISYRLTWILTIAFFILWYLVGVTLLQLKPDVFLGFLVLISIMMFGVGRVLSEVGGWYGVMHLTSYGSHESVVTGLAGVYFGKYGDNVSSYVTLYALGERGEMYSFGDRVPFYTLHSFKLSDNTKARLSGALKILVIGVVIAVVAAVFVHFFQRLYSPFAWRARGEYISMSVPQAILPVPEPRRGGAYWTKTPTQSAIQIVLGFAVIFILSVLQSRVSLLRGISIGGVIWGVNAMWLMWAPWLIALIVKYIVLRTGGAKMYEGFLKPLALGILAGAFLSMAISHLGMWLVWFVHGIKTAGIW